MSLDSSIGRVAAYGMENRIQANPGAYPISSIGYLGKAAGMLDLPCVLRLRICGVILALFHTSSRRLVKHWDNFVF